MPIRSAIRLFFAAVLLWSVSFPQVSAAMAAPVCFVYDTTYPTICGGQTYPVGLHSYTVTGSYLDTLAGSGGCDSVVLTRLTVDTTSTQIIHLRGCYQVIYDGTTYTTSTVLHNTYQYVYGCDSIVRVVVITITDTVVSDQSPVLCQGQTVSIGANTYASSGYYTDTLFNASAGGCDSIIYTLLTVIAPYTNSVAFTDTCIGSFDGQTYTSSTTFVDTFYSAVSHCDSVYLTVTIDIVPPTVITNTQLMTICAGDSFFAAGQYRHAAGTYRDTIYTAAGGCDSVISITYLSILSGQSLVYSYDSCTAVTIRGVTYGSDTVLADTTRSSLGCDSIIETDTVHIRGTAITVLSTALLPITAGDSTQLIISPTGSYQDVVWSPNRWITNRYLTNPIVVPEVSTAYIVTLQEPNLCTISAQIIVTVIPSDLPEFVMPNAFTPNGDSINDFFTPVLSPGAQVGSFHIYDRWGELVFDNAESNTNMWDGNCKNTRQPEGIYMYFITVITSSGRSVYREGSLTLLR